MVEKFTNINYKIIDSGDVEIIKRIKDATRDLKYIIVFYVMEIH